LSQRTKVHVPTSHIGTDVLVEASVEWEGG
jgi:hypothetical protein